MFVNLSTPAELQAVHISTSTSAVKLLGYATAFDGGEATYIQASAGAGLGKFQSVDGQWWVYQPDARGVNAQAFGADPTGVADSWQALQNAIDFGVYFAQCPIYAKAGRYKTTDVLSLGYGAGGFESAIFEGDGAKYAGESNFTGTVIVPTFSDRPAFAIQGARISRVRHLAVLGQNYAYINSANIMSVSDAQTVDDRVVANWIGPTMAATCNGRYTPYAAFAVDPYSGTQPGSHYPDVTYPSWLGVVAQYGKAFSSDVLIEDCWVGGFVAVLAIQPCDANGNGDFVGLRDVNGANNLYLASAGNNQGRCFGMERCVFGVFFCGLTTATHGRQNGQLNGSIVNSHFSNCIEWMDIPDAAAGGGLTWEACYGEAVWKIGKYNTGSNSAANALVMSGCKIDCSAQGGKRGVPTRMLDGGSTMPVVLQGVSLVNFYSLALMGGAMDGYTVDNCQSLSLGTGGVPNTRTNPFERLADNFLGGGWMFTPSTTRKNLPETFSTNNYGRWNVDSGAQVNQPAGQIQPSQRAYNICAWSQRLTPYLNQNVQLAAPQPWNAYDAASMSSATLSGLELTLVFTALSNTDALMLGPSPGDVIYHDASGSVFFVHSRTGTTVLATLQNNWQLNAAVYTPIDAINLASGNFYVGNSRYFVPIYYCQADLDTGSSTVTNVGRADGYGAFITTEVLIGDAVQGFQQTDGFIADGSGVVTGVDGGARTITFTNPPTRIEARKNLGFFIRKAPANV